MPRPHSRTPPLGSAFRLTSYSKSRGIFNRARKCGGATNYLDDKDKEYLKQPLRDNTLRFQMTRLSYSDFETSRSAHAPREFSPNALRRWISLGCETVRPPCMEHFQAGTFDATGHWKTGKNTNYGNTSRLESLEDEFNVPAISMLRELQ